VGLSWTSWDMIEKVRRADQGFRGITDAGRTERGFHAIGNGKIRTSVAIPMGRDRLTVKPPAQRCGLVGAVPCQRDRYGRPLGCYASPRPKTT
jgi:hypothetical protein